MAEPRLSRIVDADVTRRRVVLDLRTRHRAEAANDNRRSVTDRLGRLWPLAAALLVLAWAFINGRS